MTERMSKRNTDEEWIAYYESEFRKMSPRRLGIAWDNLTRPGVETLGDEDFRRYTRLQKIALGTVLGEDL